MSGSLDGRVAVITGGAKGLGQATGELMVGQGAAIVIADIDTAAGEGTAAALRVAGARAMFVATEITVEAEVQALVSRTVNKFGRLDILVNNAGIQVEKAVPETTEEEWDRVLDVNLKGAFLCSKHAIVEMRKRGTGSIVCVSSLSGLVSNPGQASYNASKHGLIGLAKCMAQDHATDGIRVNVVCPGSMNTPMTEGIPAEHLAPYRKANLLQRFAEPIEVARCILFLASDDASFVTGSVMVADGGYTTK